MKKKAININRRTFIRGTAATIIGLPILEFMTNSNGDAYADGEAFPQRYVFYFCPTALVADMGGSTDQLTPVNTGMGYDIRGPMQSIEDLGLQEYVSVVSGLYASAQNAPGGYNDDYHEFATQATISGVRVGFNERRSQSRGISADTIVAQKFGDQTQFDRLIFQIDPDPTSYGVSYGPEESDNGFYVTNNGQTSPAQAYRNLFSNFTTAEPSPEVELERRLRIGSLSFAKDQITKLNKKLGAADKQRLEKHFSEIRDLEMRLLNSGMNNSASCKDIMLGEDPADIAGNIPDQSSRSELFMRLSAMALTCDMTRAVVLVGSSRLTGDGMRHEIWANRGGLHGQVQHGGGTQDDMDKANGFFIASWASLMNKLKMTSEGVGNILDNTAAVFHFEGGNGGRAADGGGSLNHSTDNMTSLIAGRAGGLKSGQHLVAKDVHPVAVINTALKAIGIDDRIGEMQETLPLF